MNKRKHILTRFSTGLLLILAGIAASCTLGPNYSRPQVNVPATYKSAATQDASAPRLITRWWTLFNDPILAGLEEAALRDNPDLKAAVYRVAQARAVAGQVKSQFYPQITFNPSLTATFKPGVAPTTATQIPFDLGYEIDI